MCCNGGVTTNLVEGDEPFYLPSSPLKLVSFGVCAVLCCFVFDISYCTRAWRWISGFKETLGVCMEKIRALSLGKCVNGFEVLSFPRRSWTRHGLGPNASTDFFLKKDCPGFLG